MNTSAAQSVRHEFPWVFGLVWSVGVLAVFPAFASLIPRATPLDLTLIVSQLIPTVALAALLTVTRTWRRTMGSLRPRAGSFPVVALAILPILATMLVPSGQGAALSWPTAIWVAGIIGLHEEVFYRGFLLDLYSQGRDRGIGWTSAFFGLAHARNLVYVSEPVGIVAQISFAAGLGVLYSVIRLRTGTLWPLILAHAALDAIVLGGLSKSVALATWTDLPIWIGAAIFLAVIGLLLATSPRSVEALPPRSS